MPVLEWERPIAAQNEILGLKEVVQVTGMVAHHLGHMVQPIVLQERVHEKRVRLKIKKRNKIKKLNRRRT